MNLLNRDRVPKLYDGVIVAVMTLMVAGIPPVLGVIAFPNARLVIVAGIIAAILIASCSWAIAINFVSLADGPRPWTLIGAGVIGVGLVFGLLKLATAIDEDWPLACAFLVMGLIYPALFWRSPLASLRSQIAARTAE
jgi:hypothetical protein